MNQIKILFDELIEEKVVSELMDLDQFLDEINSEVRNEDPIIVTIFMQGSIVSLGLGLDTSFVQLINESNEPPYWVTLGDTKLDGVVDFFLHGKHHTEISQKNLIPINTARNIVREYYLTGSKSKNVQWEEV